LLVIPSAARNLLFGDVLPQSASRVLETLQKKQIPRSRETGRGSE
jgi:hypothetical protein